jgi:ketosteroid isomerase-like protein
MYAAFGRGDVPAILASLRADVDWHVNVDPKAPGASAVPLFRPRRGPVEVGQFFTDLATNLEFHSFQPQSFMSGDREVAARVLVDATVKSTGKRTQFETIHHFTFDEQERVVRFVDFLDTLADADSWNAVRAK